MLKPSDLPAANHLLSIAADLQKRIQAAQSGVSWPSSTLIVKAPGRVVVFDSKADDDLLVEIMLDGLDDHVIGALVTALGTVCEKLRAIGVDTSDYEDQAEAAE